MVAVAMLSAGLIVKESTAVAVFEAESVTATVVATVPAAVGFPLRTPAVESVNPAGNVEPFATDHVYPVPEPPAAASDVAV